MYLEALETELRQRRCGHGGGHAGHHGHRRRRPARRRFSRSAQRYGFRVHVDAAYGGYFTLIADSARRARPAGLRRHRPGRLHRHRSAQARPAALWLRLRALPRPGGGALLQARFPLHLLHFEAVAPGRDQPRVLARRSGGRGLVGHAAAFAAGARRRVCPRPDAGPGGSARTGPPTARQTRAFSRSQPAAPELDIVVWKLNAETPEQSSQRAQEVFDACAARDLHLALVQLPLSWFAPAAADANRAETGLVTCLRSVLMKPEHEAWLDRIWERLSAACTDTLRE